MVDSYVEKFLVHLFSKCYEGNILVNRQSLVKRERVAEWLRRLTRKPKVRTAVGSTPTLHSLVAVRNSSPGQPEPCEGNLVALTGSCG